MRSVTRAMGALQASQTVGGPPADTQRSATPVGMTAKCAPSKGSESIVQTERRLPPLAPESFQGLGSSRIASRS